MSHRRAPRRLASLCAVALALPAIAGAGLVPEEVPDRIVVASEPMVRGSLEVDRLPDQQPMPKVVDGDPSDWVGEPSRIGGTSRYDRGEHVHSDYVHDAWGADDGQDHQRQQVMTPLREAESRTTRLDQLFQAAGEQFGAPAPAGSPDRFGDTDGRDVADLTEVRWSAHRPGQLEFLATTSNLTDPAALGVLLLADTDGEAADTPASEPFAGLSSSRHDLALLLTDGGVQGVDLTTGQPVAVGGEVAVDAEGWSNALEARLPADLLAPDGVLRVAVVAGRVVPGGIEPLNVAYRPAEPVSGMYNDRDQALALYEGDIDAFTASIDVADLRAGRTEAVRPGGGYHERTFRSAPGISFEGGEDSLWQRYALFVPAELDREAPSPLTFWLHYRGGKAHSGGAWSPRLFTQLGEERDNIVVTPHGRGTSRWYEGSSHQDFWEVFADVHGTFEIDPTRRYLSGYSMGGYGTALFGFLYPDLFAAGYSQSGAISSQQREIAENARHFPLWIDHGAQDELVPITGLQQLSLKMRDLGYRYTMNTFVAAEHYTQAILDEWAGGARYLDSFRTPTDPRRVTYKVLPDLVAAINDGRGEPASVTYDPDGAWWVDGIEVRDPEAGGGLVDAEAHSLPGGTPALSPDVAVVAPGDYSTPFVLHGQRWVNVTADAVENRLSSTLTNVASVAFDLVRTRLDLERAATVELVTDGAGAVHLDGVPRTVPVTVDGGGSVERQGDRVTVRLPDAGPYTVTLNP